MAVDIRTWIPQFIRKTVAELPGKIIPAETWNEYFNLTFTQGDHTAEAVAQALTELATAEDAIAANEVDIEAKHTALSNTVSANEIDIEGKMTALTGRVTTAEGNITTDTAALATHKTSSDHNGIYFTEAEVSAIQANLQSQIAANNTAIGNLQTAVANLNNTFSTDAERVAAINDVIAAFDAADDTIMAVVANKADSSNVYTKAQIDLMTLFGVNDGQVEDRHLSGVAGQIKERVSTHLADAVKHITGAERTAWNGKQAALGFTPSQIALAGTATIPTTGWVANTGDNTLKYNLAIIGVLATDWVEITIDKDSQDNARDAEINPTVTEYDGGFTLYANTVPTVAIPIKYRVVR